MRRGFVSGLMLAVTFGVGPVGAAEEPLLNDAHFRLTNYVQEGPPCATS